MDAMAPQVMQELQARCERLQRELDEERAAKQIAISAGAESLSQLNELRTQNAELQSEVSMLKIAQGH